MNPEPTAIERLIPEEGWHILHIFYQIDHSNWSMLTDSEQLEAKTDLTELAQDTRTHPETQLLHFSVVSPKADIACMILTPDLHDLNAFEKRMSQSLGPVVPRVFAFDFEQEEPPLARSEMTVGDYCFAIDPNHIKMAVAWGEVLFLAD